MIIKFEFAHLNWHAGIEDYEIEAMQSGEEALGVDPHFDPALRLKYSMKTEMEVALEALDRIERHGCYRNLSQVSLE